MLNAVIFDMDGTLVDSVELHVRAWSDAFLRCGRQIACEQIHPWVGASGERLVAALLPADELGSRGKEVQQLCPQIFKAEYLLCVRPFPMVRELFERLKAAGLSIALASTAKGEELKHYARLLRIEDLLDVATPGDEIEAARPSPEFFRPALRQLGVVRPEAAAVVADTPYDMEAARGGGLRAIGLLSGGFQAAELRRAGAEEVYKDVAELLTNYEASLLAQAEAKLVRS